MAQQQQETGASPDKQALASVLSYLRDKQLKVRRKIRLSVIVGSFYRGVQKYTWCLGVGIKLASLEWGVVGVLL